MTAAAARVPSARFDPAAHSVPGELVWVSVLNSLENSSARGKARPGVLILRRDGHWMVVGLTTNGRYGDGTSRSPIPDPLSLGLRGPGFIWGDRLTRVSAIDIGAHIGWVTGPMAELVIGQAGLYGSTARSIRNAAQRHQPAAPTAWSP